MTRPIVCVCRDCIRCGCNDWEAHHTSAEDVVQVPRFLTPRPPAGAVCEVCQRRARNCVCPDGPDLG